VKKLLLATATTVVFAGAASAIPAASAVPAASPAVGPSYNCMAPAVQKQPLAQLICASPAVSKAELSYVITYSALRQTSTDAERATMRTEADAFTRRTTEDCGFQPTGYLGGRAPTATETTCLLDHFSGERGRLFMRLNGEAMDEAQLTPEQTMTIQMLLKNKGFLAANEAIDGVFGPTTRSAIGDWQRSLGQRATGYGSTALLADLQQAAAPPPAPVAAPAPAPEPVTAPAPANETRADIEVLALTCAFTVAGPMWQGELKNLTSNPTTGYVKIAARFLDADGRFVSTRTTFTEFAPVLPRQVSPFRSYGDKNPVITSVEIVGTADYGSQDAALSFKGVLKAACR
jgi:peptidoglycan hydrolase-like protein with peptidoglycan-binding domain